MANSLYPLAREAFGEGQIAWSADNIKVLLLDGTYTYSGTDQFHADIAGSAIIATSANLTGKTNVEGVMDSDNVTLSAVGGVDDIEAVVVYQDTGSSATSRLIMFYDQTVASTAILVTPDGADARVNWSNGPLKMFKL